MRRLLHILTEPDYHALLEAIFAADSIAVW